MPGKAVGRAAVDVPWLCPHSDSLLALAQRPEAAPAHARADAAFQIFLLRFARADSAGRVVLSDERLLSPHLPEAAAALLQSSPAGWLDPSHPFTATLQTFVATAATLAVELANQTQRADADEAGLAATVAALGWLAVAAVDADAAAQCRADERFASWPHAVQTERWELDHDAIARRLAERWRLPQRLLGIVGQLNLPWNVAQRLAVDADLFAVVQLAVREAERRLGSLGLTAQADVEPTLLHLGIDDGTLQRLPAAAPVVPSDSSRPHDLALLPNLLRVAADARRRNGAALVLRLEARVDQLQHALADLANHTAEQVLEARLRGLAELAGGAGHEINNPLMVISGNAKRLRQSEADPEREAVLRTIERQTERIAALIKGLMQFARPTRPTRQRCSASELLEAVHKDLLVEAELRSLQLQVEFPPTVLEIEADRDQIRQALRAIARNGVEAADEGGWVRLRAEASESHRVTFVIEDSGPGIAAGPQELMFDPFYCGRPAGRGRGLGLSIAWRLATQNGGTVRYEPSAASTTCFRVSFPQAASEAAVRERKSA